MNPKGCGQYCELVTCHRTVNKGQGMGISPAYYEHDPMEPKTIPSCLIDLPTCIIVWQLETLVTALMTWSQKSSGSSVKY